MNEPDSLSGAIAIIGMSGRFPGARNVSEFWQNLRNGKESITFFTDEELIAAGLDPDLIRRTDYVKARSLLDDPALFDADFFGITPRDAANMDPQHRLFLECAWEALEHAGYDSDRYPGPIGIYAGLYMNTYLLANLVTDRDFIGNFLSFKHPGAFQTFLGNDKDYLTTRVSYKLNLKGPGVTVQTACSTSLVAVCHACHSLLSYQCDMALAGGVTVTFPERKGYLYEEGGMLSPDGHCRAFDARAQGTVFGSGLGIVVLKRLSDAIEDGDHIHAVIKAAALNNDGALKVSYAAPSVDGQAEVIALAHAIAGITADTVDYVEAHGTGTPLGDPIEVAALTKAFRQTTDATGFCKLGAVKTNIGHLDVAAGVTGLIKTALALENREIPPTLHFEQPNPKIDFENSPFRVVTALTPWEHRGHPRRAGVSSFGVGGTNAHVLLEETPQLEASSPSSRPGLLLLSARTRSALDQMSRNLAAHLRQHPEEDLADVAYTLQTGRRVFAHRRCVVAHDNAEAISLLEQPGASLEQERRDVPVVFLFPGQGSQMPCMGAELYATEPVYKAAVDDCAALLQSIIGCDLREVLFPSPERATEAEAQLRQTRFTQPAIFVTSYALAQLWMAWGIRPQAMIGHSVGEYVAACLAGTLSLEDALMLVANRARIVQDLPGGSMLAARAPEANIIERVTGNMAIAAVNAPSLCVVAGPDEEIAELEQLLTGDGVACKKLPTSHAFHSPMMEPALEPFRTLASTVTMHTPSIPFVSCLTGKWITADDAVSPEYWTSHLRNTVRFADALSVLIQDQPEAIFLEVGPGQTLYQAARQQVSSKSVITLVSSLPNPGTAARKATEAMQLHSAVGKLWAAGATIDWTGFHQDTRRLRLALPTYPFERQRHWIEPLPISAAPAAPAAVQSQSATAPRVVNGSNGCKSPAPPQSVKPRREQILERVGAILFDMSGVQLRGEAASATFLDLGFDSLFLAQARQSLQNEFGMKLTFRQLLDDLPTPAALADYLDSQLPPDAFPVTCPEPHECVEQPKQIAATAAEMPADATGVLTQIQSQLQQLTQEVAALRKGDSRTSTRFPLLVNRPDSQERPAPNGKLFGPFRPVNKVRDNGISPAQQRSLDAFIEGYHARTQRSKKFAQEFRRTLADPRSVAGFRRTWKDLTYQIVIERSQGSRVWDADGNEYIDITNGFGVTFFGHTPKFITDAITTQLAHGVHIGPQAPLAGEVATLVRELTGMDRVTFCNTGSEAVMAAMRVARTVTGRQKVVYFTGDYHGTFDEVLLRAHPAGPGNRSLPIAPGIPPETGSNIIVLEYGTPESLQIIQERASEIAAVIVEPVQSRHPDLVPVEFLRELRHITRETGSLLVFDEVITGFRVHPGGCQALFGIEADLATYGKVAGGGIPIGILAGRGTYLDAIDGGWWQFGDDSAPEADMTFFAGTFVRHPLALAAARAVLLYLREHGPVLQKELNERTERFVSELNAFFERESVPMRLMHFSSLFRFAPQADLPLLNLFFYHLLAEGIYIREAAQNCFLSLAHTDADLDGVKEGIARAVTTMRKSGFLPPAPLALDSILPLTNAQREIWLACQLGETASRAYNESFTVRLFGKFDAEQMRVAVQAVLSRHEALRTVFLANGSGQRVLPAIQPEIPLHDFSSLPENERFKRVQELQNAETATAFDLVNGPLSRFQLVKLAPEEHLLLITAHHLVCDGWSGNLVLNDIRALYAAPDAELPESVPFREYIQRELSLAESPERQASEDYWTKQFSSIPPALELPTEFPRPRQRTFRGGRVTCVLSTEALDAVKQTSRAQGCTLYVGLLAAFQTLLHRLTGQTDLVVGLPVAGQSLSGFDALVGHCVNLLPLRTRIEPGASFAERMKSTRTLVLEAHENGEFTFSQLLESLSIPRDTGYPPLVSVIFNLDSSLGDLGLEGLQITTEHNSRQAYQFDLGFNLVEERNGLRIECDYSEDLFGPETAQRLLNYYCRLLEAAISTPETPLNALPLLDSDEKQRLLVEWNNTAREFPSDKTLHEIFTDIACRHAKAIAVVDGLEQLSYEAIAKQASGVAVRLGEKGVRTGALVGLPAERSLAFVVNVLAILQAGAAYVPLDPDEPAERLARLAAACDFVIGADGAISGAATRGENRPARPEDPAYVLFTSGSTGEPKGVVVPHRAVARLVCNSDYVAFKPDDVVALASNPCFDAITFELWGALLNGCRLVVTPKDVLLSPSILEEHLRKHGITTLFLTTSLFNQHAQQSPAMFRSLRNLVFGGEAADATSVRMVIEHGKPAILVNGYGPTETTTFAVCHTVEHAPGARIPIGRPIANTQAYILDQRFEPVPIGATGELFIGGPGLALGYLDSPELTAERFVVTPYGKLYKSGDLARWLPDGTIDYQGRTDHQIKLRGFRIEPGEIESAMQKIPGVARCAVIVREVSMGDRRLVAYYTSCSNPAPSTAALKEALTSVLPAFMVPNAFVQVTEFPLTANGKLAHDQLPLPAEESAVQESYVGPNNALHAQIIEIWEELLDRRPLGIRDNFFVSGGHSLLAARMLMQVEQRFGKRLPFAALFENPTIEHLSGILLTEQQATAREQPYAAIHSSGTKRPFFFLHGDYVGGGFFCQNLAQRIGSDRPFYAVHPHGLTGDRPKSTAAMAAERLATIRAIQPHGPYLLGGYCNGALTAFEIARLLEAEGEEVVALVLLTADGSSYRMRHLETLADLVGRLHGETDEQRRERFLRWHHQMRLTQALAQHYAPVGRNFLRRPWRVNQLAQRLRGKSRSSAGVPAETPATSGTDGEQTQLATAFQDAMLGFVPHSFGGKVTLLWPEAEPIPSGDPAYGWREVCAELDLELVPGSHHSCVAKSANLTVIGDKMREILAAAESGATVPSVPLPS